MKKFLIMAVAFLMLSFGCLEKTESRACGCASREAASAHKGMVIGSSNNLTKGVTESLAELISKRLENDSSSLVCLKVSRVIDGDTFEGRLAESGNPGVNPWAYELTKVVVRINGIVAPERGQFYGDVATLHLYSLIGGKTVGLKLKQKDFYGRWIATVYLDCEDVAEELLRQGLAWHFKEHDSNPRYAQLENEARWNGFGLWRDDRPVAPWRWRRMSKAERDAYRNKE
jgi:endonuclease YncB( thermonuclease family)